MNFFFKKKWLEQCPDDLKLVSVEDMMSMYYLYPRIIKFREYLSKCHITMSFSFEQERNGK